MFLVTAATTFELEAFTGQWSGKADVKTCTTGVGPVETATRLTRYLAEAAERPTAVVNIGVGGAYLQEGRGFGAKDRPGLLDLCLAQREILGDLGVCYGNRIEPLSLGEEDVRSKFELDRELIGAAERVLVHRGFKVWCGTFITVSGVSATAERGGMLAGTHNGLCENMEGAAVARVCEEFSLPLLELRCVSNMVENRNRKNWKIREAAQRCGAAAALVIGGLSR